MNEREVLKKLAKRKTSHAEIGEKLGITQASVTRMLNGTTPMRADRFAEMCEAVGAKLIIEVDGKRLEVHGVNGEVVISIGHQ